MQRRRGALSLVLITIVAWSGWTAAGCGSSSSSNGAGDGGGASSGTDGGLILSLGSDAGTQGLVVQPANAVLDVTSPGTVEAFQAWVNGSAVPAQWTIDAPAVGSIDATGRFTASGLVGGTLQVSAVSGALSGSTSLTVHLHLTENLGNVPPPTQTKLQAGGTGDSAFAWLYPYDQTVFPRDLPAPTLQFAGSATTDAGAAGFDAALVQVTLAGLDYEGFYGPSTLPSQIPLSATAWKAISLSASAGDAVKVSVTKIAGGVVTGPITETWTIAPGNLRGSIFYNSYNSALAAPPASSGFPLQTGAVLKLRPSEQTLSVVIPTNNQGECHVCHAVSANGTIMEAANEANGKTFQATDAVYDLTNGGALLYTPVQPDGSADNRIWDFSAITPDGTRLLRFGSVPFTNPNAGWAPNVRGMGEPRGTPSDDGDRPSAMFDPRTGAPIAAPGLDGAKLHMMMPTFSSDGKEVAFNHFDTGAGHTIAVMDYDLATNTFSNLRDVATLPATSFAGWPTFTPDDKYVLFASGTNAEYDTLSDSPPNPPQPQGDIYIAHVPSGTIAAADALNGVRKGASYLPFADDAHLSFEPTILPVASGGYYWVVFTTRRNYGNTINGDPYVGAGGAPSSRKKLWVAAIDIAAASGEVPVTSAADITHPAFYLDGQELESGNMRAFWALDPCQSNGTSCATGDVCCTGFCRETAGGDGGASFTCVAPPTGCSQESEKCTIAGDCCGAAQGYACINGFCARPSPK